MFRENKLLIIRILYKYSNIVHTNVLHSILESSCLLQLFTLNMIIFAEYLIIMRYIVIFNPNVYRTCIVCKALLMSRGID